MSHFPLVWVIIGVSGAGKTAVGRLFAKRLECDFLEGDRRHPPANIAKMASQTPLQDEDRQQWLSAIEGDLRRAIDLERETVITCSALKVDYRKRLATLGAVHLVWLNVPEPELERRLADRSDHYMKLEMLHSQLETFETIASNEDVIEIAGVFSPEETITKLLDRAKERYPDLDKSWWERAEQR